MTPIPLLPLPALEALLDAEMRALAEADFSGLDALAQRKAALLEALEDGLPPLPEELEHLRAKARRNAVCILAARRGLGAARRRLVELSQMRDGAETYDARGQRAVTLSGVARLEHRA